MPDVPSMALDNCDAVACCRFDLGYDTSRCQRQIATVRACFNLTAQQIGRMMRSQRKKHLALIGGTVLLLSFCVFAVICTFAADIDGAIYTIANNCHTDRAIEAVEAASQTAATIVEDIVHDTALAFHAPLDSMARTLRYRSRFLMRARVARVSLRGVLTVEHASGFACLVLIPVLIVALASCGL
ncbi:hypothetical protein UFOVP75_15 [uncultured Caudovirales phage]|uniref:Uncharacterized protein n=1 Tax=uncultured Caudovirales phage TaxID=2100421 RepID=A0A6J5KZ94_9CAUD|nr:hypothetical protein UFOVP75_15 [uncultured Caudovirales phage]